MFEYSNFTIKKRKKKFKDLIKMSDVQIEAANAVENPCCLFKVQIRTVLNSQSIHSLNTIDFDEMDHIYIRLDTYINASMKHISS